ncbi:MAG: hypothetical protein WA063_03570 [Minisyncoccia bacterium]
MAESKKLDENATYFEALSLVARIQEKKMTLVSLRQEATEDVISVLNKIGWIVAEGEDSEIEVTAKWQKCMTQYRAMIVLENIRNRMEAGNDASGMKKADLESNSPSGVVDLLKGKEFIFFKETGEEYPNDFVCKVTEKGKKRIRRIF